MSDIVIEGKNLEDIDQSNFQSEGHILIEKEQRTKYRYPFHHELFQKDVSNIFRPQKLFCRIQYHQLENL